MSLQGPVKDLLRKTTTPASVARMWSRVEARTRTKARAAPGRRWALMLAAAALVVSVLLVVSRGKRAAEIGPILREDGAPLRAEEGERVVRLSDGSAITLARGAAFEPLESSALAVVLRHARGRIDYDITPGGPRRWTIECGLANVQVVGTSFRIDRDASGVRVDVTRGVVLVRGDTIPDRVVQLGAGMHIEVTAPRGAATADPSAASSNPKESATAAPANASEARSAAPAKPRDEATWRTLAARGENAKAYAELGPGGVSREARAASVAELLALADVARLSGHPREAIEPLERIVAEHHRDSRASLAAFTLGQIHLRSLGSPAAAARALEQAIALGIPSGLAEDAYALLIESLAESGDDAAARDAYARYAAQFPASARVAEARRWIREP